MKQKKSKRIFIAVLSAILMLSMTISFSFATTQSSTQEKIDSNKTKSSQLESDMAELETKLSDTKAEIKALDDEIAPLQEKVEENQEKLEEQQAELEEQETNLDERLRNMYKNGSIGFIDVLLSSNSITELLDNFQMVSEIYSGDQDVVELLEEEYDDISATQKELEDQEAALSEKEDELSLSLEEMYDTYSQMEADKATVDKETEELTSELASLQAQQTAAAASSSAKESSSASKSSTSSSSSSGSSKASTSKSTSSSASVTYSGTGSDVANYALQFVGLRYVWGGASLKTGVDCSGFTMLVYKHFGVSLPHYSESQINYGTRVSKANAKPGDLVHYSGHVGIYIGGGKMVHASNPRDGVKISNTNYRSGATFYRIL